MAFKMEFLLALQRPVACSSVNLEVLINLLVIGGDPSGIGGPSDFLRGAVKGKAAFRQGTPARLA